MNGPANNVSAALELDPSIKDKIKEVVGWPGLLIHQEILKSLIMMEVPNRMSMEVLFQARKYLIVG